MKKGQGTGLAMIVSLIVLIIIITQYFIFFVIFPNKVIQPDPEQYIRSEIDLDLISFVELNSDLIVKSVINDDYKGLKEKMKKLEPNRCWEIKINQEIINNCKIKDSDTTIMNIPDYNNNPIKIILNINKK